MGMNLFLFSFGIILFSWSYVDSDVIIEQDIAFSSNKLLPFEEMKVINLLVNEAP